MHGKANCWQGFAGSGTFRRKLIRARQVRAKWIANICSCLMKRWEKLKPLTCPEAAWEAWQPERSQPVAGQRFKARNKLL